MTSDVWDAETAERYDRSSAATLEVDGRARRGESNFRYVWPSELDLMAQLAGMGLEQRWAGFDGSPFTADSESHVSVWRRP